MGRRESGRHAAASLQDDGIQVQDMTYLSQLSLPMGGFDTKNGEPSLPESLRNQSTGDGWYLVQFIAPAKEAWRENLAQLGEIACYLPQCTYLVHLTEDGRSTVANWPKVRWVGPYHPGYRLAEDLSGTAFTVRFFPGHEAEGATALAEPGLTVHEAAGDSASVEGTVEQVQTAGALDSVMAVTESHGPSSFVTTARGTGRADAINGRGLVGRPSGGGKPNVGNFEH